MRRCQYGRRIPQVTSTAPTKKPSKTGRYHQESNNLHPTSNKFEPIPNINSRRNNHGPPEALRGVPSSKGGKNHNNGKGADGNMDFGGGVPRTKTLPTSTALDFKGWRPRTKMEYLFTKQAKIKGQHKGEKITSSSREGVLDYIYNLTYRGVPDTRSVSESAIATADERPANGQAGGRHNNDR